MPSSAPPFLRIVAAVGIRPSFYPTHSLFDLSPTSLWRYSGTRLPMRTVQLFNSLATLLTILSKELIAL
ncbi:hypothetical protein TMatcc_006952 [Talaromyces marneffei ATCC 18224]